MSHNNNEDQLAYKFNALVADVDARIEMDNVPIDLRLSMRKFWSVIKSCWAHLIAKPKHERHPVVIALCREAVDAGVLLFLETIRPGTEKDKVERAVMFLDSLAAMFEDFSAVEEQAEALLQQAAKNRHQQEPTAPYVKVGGVVGFPICPN